MTLDYLELHLFYGENLTKVKKKGTLVAQHYYVDDGGGVKAVEGTQSTLTRTTAPS
jgi:hypothetical protein